MHRKDFLLLLIILCFPVIWYSVRQRLLLISPPESFTRSNLMLMVDTREKLSFLPLPEGIVRLSRISIWCDTKSLRGARVDESKKCKTPTIKIDMYCKTSPVAQFESIIEQPIVYVPDQHTTFEIKPKTMVCGCIGVTIVSNVKAKIPLRIIYTI